VKKEEKQKKKKRIKDDEIIRFTDVLIDLILYKQYEIVRMKINMTFLTLLRFT
jgi:hypothetical protein